MALMFASGLRDLDRPRGQLGGWASAPKAGNAPPQRGRGPGGAHPAGSGFFAGGGGKSDGCGHQPVGASRRSKPPRRWPRRTRRSRVAARRGGRRRWRPGSSTPAMARSVLAFASRVGLSDHPECAVAHLLLGIVLLDTPGSTRPELTSNRAEPSPNGSHTSRGQGWPPPRPGARHDLSPLHVDDSEGRAH